MISVIVPVYNGEKTIKQCLDSILAQTYKNYEIVVINDGSIDNTENIVLNYINENKNVAIKYFKQKNMGVACARNNGIQKATGDYIAFLDSDDFWIKTKLEYQMSYLESNPDIGLFCTKIGTAHSSQIKEINFLKMLFKSYIYPSTAIIPRKVLTDVGVFPENRRYFEEGDLFLRIGKKYKIKMSNKGTVKYGFNKKGFGESGLTANLKEMEKGDILNLTNALERDDISFALYLFAVIFSLIRYCRRILITKFCHE